MSSPGLATSAEVTLYALSPKKIKNRKIRKKIARVAIRVYYVRKFHVNWYYERSL
jgi:hypothetical protein